MYHYSITTVTITEKHNATVPVPVGIDVDVGAHHSPPQNPHIPLQRLNRPRIRPKIPHIPISIMPSRLLTFLFQDG